jgi:Putative peptidoglycan-binding domain-containing protein
MAKVITDLHPRLQEKIQLVAAKCKEQDLIIGIGECLRTVAEQDALYAQGRTTAGNIVTYAKGSTYSSQHQWGIAFDFYRNDGTGAFNEDGKFFEKVGAVGKSLGLGWGGDWTSIKDKPHLYLLDWGSTTTSLKQKYGTPGMFFATWGTGGSVVAAETPKQESEQVNTGDDWIRQLQVAIGAKPDNLAGPETLSKTPTISKTKNRKHPAVSILQTRLNSLGYPVGTVDGIAGNKFDEGLKAYQKQVVFLKYPDGELTSGKNTWKSLLGLK